MNNQTAYWIWLQEAVGYGSRKIPNILNKFTFAEDFYRAPLEEKLTCGCFKQKDIDKLKDTSLENARRIIKRCNECGIDIINIGDVAYPQRLMEISAPPAVIYIRGNKDVLSDSFSIAMVGTRTATPYGMRNAFRFAYDLAKNGITVISGGALGIDTYSHRGVLQADGKTVCVLGCGISYKYLRENDEMKKQIIRRGAVISEYPPDMRASRYTFPQRNRIISGLSRGVLVIEAGSNSGSLITANLALEQERDVFSVPGDISSSVSFGTNQLIKDGAAAVTSASDILDFYRGNSKGRQKTKRKAVSTKKQTGIIYDGANHKNSAFENNNIHSKRVTADKKTFANEACSEPKNVSLLKLSEEDFNNLSENLRKVLMSFDSEIMHIDKLVEKSGLPVNIVHSAVTQLEMYDYIESCQGRNYKILVSIK